MKHNLIGFAIGMLLVLLGTFLVSGQPGVAGSIVITLGLMIELFFLVRILKRVWQARNEIKR